jgi:hypothetical protein
MTQLHHRRPSRVGRCRPRWARSGVGLDLDLLRADLYRLLDEVARAGPERHRELVREFERAWSEFRDATGVGR